MILHPDDRALKVMSLYVTVLGALVTALFALKQTTGNRVLASPHGGVIRFRQPRCATGRLARY
ncbi:hypothetical protein [Bradyrhizobium sp.]|jgi:hypothetical protein|uniref:hypothetical protein n=1 Tax=Bradyrhizobium sp. TaxID=376 RepID=UPI002DF83690|nr:hypothetical protein [Bradyrhizobium sp.]